MRGMTGSQRYMSDPGEEKAAEWGMVVGKTAAEAETQARICIIAGCYVALTRSTFWGRIWDDEAVAGVHSFELSLELV
jgi:hypothetical protein